MAESDNDKTTTTKSQKSAAPGPDPDFEYKLYRPEQQLQAVQSKSRSLEETHFQRRLDLELAKEGKQADNIKEEIDVLEGDIASLRAIEATAQSLVDAEQAAQESASTPPV